MKKLLALLGVVCLCAAGPTAEAKKRSSSPHKAVTRRTAAAPNGRKSVTRTAAVSGGTSRSSRGRKTVAGSSKRWTPKSRQVAIASSYRRTGQLSPTSDRYREIQQALQAKGYYNGPVDGQWSGDTVGALQKFQKDQNLKPDGKLDSLSLIALGLGPKHELTAQTRTSQP